MTSKIDGHSVTKSLSVVEVLLDLLAVQVHKEGYVEVAEVLWDAIAAVAWARTELQHKWESEI